MHDTNLLEDQPIAWTPTPDVIERAQLTKFMRQVGVSTWDELYEFSIRDVETFTEEVLKFLDIRFDPPYEKLLDTSDGIEFPEWFSRSDFPQSRKAAKEASIVADESEPRAVATGSHAGLNITTMCIDRWQTDEMKDQPAVIWEREEGDSHVDSYDDLILDVKTLAAGLRLHGFRKGDAIGIHMPMTPATVSILLAIARIGAIAVPVFSGYGVSAIEARLNAVNAKALFTCDGFTRRGKPFAALDIADNAVSRCPSVQKVFYLQLLSVPEIDTSNFTSKVPFIDFLELLEVGERGFTEAGQTFASKGAELSTKLLRKRFAESLDTVEPTSAEDPLIILYTSGTTGKPKGIAHTHASFPIKAAQDMAFGTDVGKGTRISWYTDIGWMMGPWLIYGALINGATICIYDGAPDYPTPDRMWEFCAKHKVEILGISPTLIRALAAHEDNVDSRQATGAQASCLHEAEGRKGAKDSTTEPLTSPGGDVAGRMPALQSPRERHDLSSLRMFASTGEPWNPAPWWWLFEKVGNSKLPIINYSGGTEIAGGILMGNPLLPIKPCSFPAPCPGMDVDILDEEGNPVGPNQVGELVIKQPWIGMARGFWQEKERYFETYWRRFKNIWVHGDWAMRDKDGYWFILGRSDDTLKVAGKRVGPAEVESLLVAHPLVIEAAVIGVPDEKKGTAMVAFCVLSAPPSGSVSSVHSVVHPSNSSGTTEHTEEDTEKKELEMELKALVAKDMGKPLAPSKIHFVSALPKTRNAKVMRRVIRAAYLGEDAGDLSALENPQAIDEIRIADM